MMTCIDPAFDRFSPSVEVCKTERGGGRDFKTRFGRANVLSAAPTDGGTEVVRLA